MVSNFPAQDAAAASYVVGHVQETALALALETIPDVCLLLLRSKVLFPKHRLYSRLLPV
jgi:hypothetical protein